MHLQARPLHLQLREPFRIAHGTSSTRTNALVTVDSAVGEAGLPPYLDTTYDDVAAFVAGLDLELLPETGTLALDRILTSLPEGPAAARCAVDLALHDLWGQRLGQPLYALFGLDPANIPIGFSTIPILDDERAVQDRVRALPPGARIKLKVGSGDLEHDEALIRWTRSATQAPICVDANGAWDIPNALSLLPRLTRHELLFVEQPIAAGDIDDWHLLRRLLGGRPVPVLIADESLQTADDAIALAGAADGVNIKLAKCGGIRAARQLISIARTLDLKIMIGCMVESSVALAAAAHLAPLADFADLDSVLMLKHDPFEGVLVHEGVVQLSGRPGLGVRARD